MDLVIAHVSKDYGRGSVLRDVSLTVPVSYTHLRAHET